MSITNSKKNKDQIIHMRTDGEHYVLTTGYCYSPWNGSLKEYHGDVMRMDGYVSGRYVIPESTYFIAKDENGKVIKKLNCSSVEGNIWNKLVWLTESDISKAAEIFIDYEETRIAALKDQIKNHEITIELLAETDIDISQYARWFDTDYVQWTRDPVYNKMVLKHQQEYCNDLLKAKGYLFLNDVYEILSIPKSKAGQVVGWIYDEGKSIDFGLNNDINRDFMMCVKDKALLNFNVDGIILDRI